MEDILVPLFFFASVFGFPLLRRQMIHRHQLELLQAQRTLTSGHNEGQRLSPEPTSTADLALQLPEPHRLYALAILCRLQDAPGNLDAQANFVVQQTRSEYLPATLHAYLNLTPAARATLTRQGVNAEHTLREQLELINQGLTDALRLDHVAANRLLTQGRFLAQKFDVQEDRELVLSSSSD